MDHVEFLVFHDRTAFYPDESASIDLTLGSHFLKVDENVIDRITLDSELRYLDLHADAETEEIVIPPLSFLLAVTRERIRLPANMTAFVEGRSSIGRIGLFIQNAGWVYPGFDGTIALRLQHVSSARRKDRRPPVVRLPSVPYLVPRTNDNRRPFA